MRRRWALLVLVASLVGAAVAPEPAGAVSMTLKSVTVKPTPGSEECCVLDGPKAWTYSAEGRTAEFNSTNGCLKNTWSFPMPSSIPDAGTKITFQITAHANCSNTAPFMGARGSVVEGGVKEIFAPLADQNNPSQSASGEVSLKPVNGTATVEVGLSDGPKWTYTYTAEATQDGCDNRARAAANEVRVVAVQQGAAYRRAGTAEDDWRVLCKDTVLQQGDEISLDPDGAATLQFGDNSTVVVKDTTQLKIASFFTEGGTVKTEILLRMGQIAARVPRSFVAKSDFRIRSPAWVASVRDTAFTVFYDPGSKAGITTTFEGVVTVDPTKPGLKTVLVPAGKEVEVTSRSISKVVRAGKAGARGGLNRQDALAKVVRVVAKGNGPCRAATPRTSAFAVRPTRGGWKVSVKLLGGLRGTSRWTVKGGRTKPANALARKLRAGCR
jgi:hypothetical protein